MSPKKSVKNQPVKRKIEKMPKRTVKKGKQKLNDVPANIQVSIPFTRKTMEELETFCPTYTHYKKDLDYETKVELANDVVRKQLVKKESPTIMTEVPNQVPKRGRGRKKLIPDFFNTKIVVQNNVKADTVSSSEPTSTKKKSPAVKPPPARTTRIVTRKRLADSTANQNQTLPKVLKLETNAEADCIATKIKTEKNVDAVSDSSPIETFEPIGTSPFSKNLIISHCETIVTQSQPSTNVTLKRPRRKAPQTATKQLPARKKKTPAKGKKENIMAPDKPPEQTPKQAPDLETQDIVKPGPIDSRKTSVSSNSNLSWTRDISSSSAATCITVNTNDFIRFNKKLPVIKLTHVDHEVKKPSQNETLTEDVEKPKEVADKFVEDDNTSDSSSSSSDSDSSSESSLQNDAIDVNSLNLSVSSHPTNIPPQIPNSNNIDYTKAAEKLAMSIKKIDKEIISWLSSELDDINGNLVKFKEKMFETLDTEFGVITHCRCLKELWDPPKKVEETIVQETQKPVSNVIEESHAAKEVESHPVVDIHKDVEFAKPRPCRKPSVIPDCNLSNINQQGDQNDNSNDDYPTGAYYDHHDDDDALSLYAESITGIESSRMNASVVSAPTVRRPPEEYIPKPLKQDIPQTDKHTYCPTKITDTAEILASKIKSICEKQNADSTSIFKQSNSTDDAESYQDLNDNGELNASYSHLQTNGHPEAPKPCLMESRIQLTPNAKSVVFGKVCYFNLLKRCAYTGQCRFPHVTPTAAQISFKLKLLDERMLVQEYLSMRGWAQLRIRYAMCFAEEFKNRGFTRYLVEVAFDCIKRARSDSDEDSRLRVEIIELTLLHLNNVDLRTCEDLLKLTVDQHGRTLLCDVFMAIMSITQNFSRFKSVFLNLTNFMVDNYRTFNKDVVEHILERVCILPYEEPVAKALMQMMRLTKPDIFKNSMIRLFEKQISGNKELYGEFSLRKQLCELVCRDDAGDSPVPDDDAASDGQPPAPSPDTTNIDNLNKKVEEPMKTTITRTIGMNPPILFQRDHDAPGPSRPYESSESSNSDDIVKPRQSQHKVEPRKWRNRSIFPHLAAKVIQNGSMVNPQSPGTPMRPQMRHMRPPQRTPFSHRLVIRSPANYMNRLPGPKY